jgi:hypothetical protein
MKLRFTDVEMHQNRMAIAREKAMAPVAHMNRQERRTPQGRKAVKAAEANAAQAQLLELAAEKLRLQ